jgi:negative regulator of flagellin synthesis FlgM
MKIDSINSNSPLLGGAKARAPGGTRPEPAGNAPQESVAIGATAAAAASSGAPVDAARVQAIRQAISEGRFQVNAEAVADRLIESARELIEARRGA